MKGSGVILAVMILTGTAWAQEQPLRYDFESLRRKVTVSSGGAESVARQGDAARGGDRIMTNWCGRAVVAVTERGSRFEIFASTRVKLATDEPGVLVELERGRLKAWFDKLTDVPIERFIKTPGAILAVRGTRYGVEVDGRGETFLNVFEGIVEVRQLGPQAAPPLFVRAGESCAINHGSAPQVGPMHRSESDWDHGRSMSGGGQPGMNGEGMSPGMRDGGMPDGGMRDGGMSGPGSTGHGGSGGSTHHGGE
jgi:ferric-dicitrate binding protein FerR (iron transport regulator)